MCEYKHTTTSKQSYREHIPQTTGDLHCYITKGKIKSLNMVKNNGEGRNDRERTCPLPPLLFIINFIKHLGKYNYIPYCHKTLGYLLVILEKKRRQRSKIMH